MKTSFSGLTRVLSLLLALPGFLLPSAHAFNINSNSNLAAYWGQDDDGTQQTLSYYCGSDSVVDAFPIAFVDTFFDEGGLPNLNLANICDVSGDGAFSGTNLPNCQFLASDIKTCQAAGKIVTISLGGGGGSVGFSSNSQAETFAETIWNLFLGGSSSTRPFGSAVLDGVDLDIESGSNTGYAAFVKKIRSLSSGASKKYYVTGAPQCPFPDEWLGNALNNADFDAVYVQFYNNYCELTYFNNPDDWNFGTWDNWAKNTSPNKNVKVYIGALANSYGGEGYVDPDTFANIIEQTQNQYSSFGGVMLWDIDDAYDNNRYDVSVKNALNGDYVIDSKKKDSSKAPSSSSKNSTESKTSPSGKNSRFFRL